MRDQQRRSIVLVWRTEYVRIPDLLPALKGKAFSCKALVRNV